jgi:hypothetical protein
MDRVSRKFIILLGIVCAMPAWAGTVLMYPPPKSVAGSEQEIFPESRFGSQPIQRRTDLEPTYVVESHRSPASEQAAPRYDDSGYTDSGYGHNRSPAGLMNEADMKNAPPRPQPKFDKVVRDAADNPPDPAEVAKTELNSMVTGTKGVQEVALIAGDLGFFPKTVFVNRDIPVRMYVTGASRNTLCIMMDSFQVRKQVRSQKIEEIIFTPNQPGKFRFYCPVNGMEGTMIVRELASKVSE